MIPSHPARRLAVEAPTPRRLGMMLCAALSVAGCAKPEKPPIAMERPNITAARQPIDAKPLALDASQIRPMYTEMLSIDLPTVVRVAQAENFDIRQARLNVEANQGRYESAVGGALPAIVPTAVFDYVDGSVRATEGDIVGVGFKTFQPSIAVQWLVNPGRVIYDIIAAKKRLSASAHREEAVVLETLRHAAEQYYSLALAQASVSAAHQGVLEADELLRISRLRQKTGTGVPADELRAEARLARRNQDLVTALKTFYDVSVSLATTLHLDASVTLVPGIESLPPVRLVRPDLTIEELLGYAIAFRPDLQSVRTLVEVAAAEKGSTWWSGFGPTLLLSYQYGGITGHSHGTSKNEGIPNNLTINPFSSTGSFSSRPFANGLIREGIHRLSNRRAGRDDQAFSFSDQQVASASASWRLSLATFGQLKTSRAREKQAAVEAARAIDRVRAEVISASQATKANEQLIALARQQVVSAEEALRLTQVNLQAGAMTLLDVLQAQDAATQARLRYAQAVVRYNQSQVNQLAALGLLNETTLLPRERDDVNTGDTDSPSMSSAADVDSSDDVD